jgi:hypothetical protein
MSQESKSREFWIRPPHEIRLPFGACSEVEVLGGVHVIEYQAYTDAMAEQWGLLVVKG